MDSAGRGAAAIPSHDDMTQSTNNIAIGRKHDQGPAGAEERFFNDWNLEPAHFFA